MVRVYENKLEYKKKKPEARQTRPRVRKLKAPQLLVVVSHVSCARKPSKQSSILCCAHRKFASCFSFAYIYIYVHSRLLRLTIDDALDVRLPNTLWVHMIAQQQQYIVDLEIVFSNLELLYICKFTNSEYNEKLLMFRNSLSHMPVSSIYVYTLR